MVLKGIVATTKVDAHNTRITLAALEKAAEDVNNGKYAISVGIEHDPTIIPIGKVTKAYVAKIDDTDYGLYFEQDMFSAYSTVIGGETYVMQKSLVDDRPLFSAALNSNNKLLVQTDSINFSSRDEAESFFKELSEEYDIEAGYIGRKSLIPDPELIFQLLEKTVVVLFAYLTSKSMVEKVGNHITDHALSELDGLYNFVKKAIAKAAKQFVPANRPVTYIFTGKNEFVIELVVQTTSPDVAIRAIKEDKLVGAINEIEKLRKCFPKFTKIQLLCNIETENWEFNYIATETGEVIGTEKSYKKSVQKMELAFPQKTDVT